MDVPLRISTFLDQEAINVHLDAIPKVPSAPLKLAFYALDERYSFLEIFNEWKPAEYKGTSLTRISETEKYILYKFYVTLPEKFKIKCPKCNEEFYETELRESEAKESTYFLRFKELPFAIVVSNSHFKESDYTFSFFNKYYPFMSRILLRAKQLSDILSYIEERKLYGSDVYSQDFILKRYYAGKETERHYKKRDFKSIFAEARQKKLWLDNITFRVPEKGRIQLSRDGKIQFYDDFVFSDVLPLIDLIMLHYNESYTLIKKTELKRKNSESTSIKIILEDSSFEDKESVLEFINYLNKYKDSDLNIMSMNGGYFESSLIDYKTGTSIDICVYKANIITLIPQFQTNTISLINLINYIQEEYDGRIEN